MKPATFTLAAVIFAGMAIPQDLPPGVLLLSRVKHHIQEELKNLPNITCLETVQREYQLKPKALGIEKSGLSDRGLLFHPVGHRGWFGGRKRP